MNTIAHAFGIKVGYSDHTVGINVPVAAVAMGASVIEKHLTLDRNMKGPDHKASLEPDQFSSMVHAIRTIEQALGDGIKKATESEIPNKIIARKSLVASRLIRKGEKFTEFNITCKRPGSGISPMHWDLLLAALQPENTCPTSYRMVSAQRKICVVTGTRAEYGLLRRLIDAIHARMSALQLATA